MATSSPVILEAPEGGFLSRTELEASLNRFAASLDPKPESVLLVPPDGTRRHSGAGIVTSILYHRLAEHARVCVMPATGTHRPMSPAELEAMFSGIPRHAFLAHDFRRDSVPIGTIPGEVVAQLSEGILQDPIEVSLSRSLLDAGFDLIVSIGQVLPHEVVGMSNYTKNIVVGLGGEDIINQSHYLSAVYGIERTLGRERTPVRALCDYAEEHLLSGLPIQYVLTANQTQLDPQTGYARPVGIYMGRQRSLFEQAAARSRAANVTWLEEPAATFVVYLDEKQFRSTWLGCKAIYRTRLAVADGGCVVIVAPGLERLGEDPLFDRIIRTHGYAGKTRIMERVQRHEELQRNLAVAAHLIHGSSEGRFEVVVASDSLERGVLEAAHFRHISLQQAQKRYHYDRLAPGPNRTAGGETIYYIANPATGLWAAKGRLGA